MAYGLTQDDEDPIYKTAEQARAGLPAYGGVNREDMPPPPRRAAITPPPPAARASAPAAPAPGAGPNFDEMIPVTFEPRTSTDARPDNPAMAGMIPVTFDMPHAPSDKSSFRRGLETSWEQTKQTAAGTVALAGDAFGLEGMKNWGMDKYKDIGKNVDALSSENDDIYKALSKDGSMSSYLGYAAGYLSGQAGQMVLGAGVGGFIGKALLQKGAQKLIGGMMERKAGEFAAEELIAKGMGEAAAKEQAAQMVANGTISEATKLKAAAYAAESVGAGIATYGLNSLQETGGIYGTAAENYEKGEGPKPEVGRILAAGQGAAALDTFVDMGALGRVLHGAGHGSNIVGRTIKAGLAQGIKEAGTEGAQTVMERWGAQQSLTDQDAIHDYLNSMAMGAIGGGAAGVIGGARGRSAEQQRLREEGAPAAQTPPGVPAPTRLQDIPEGDVPDVVPGSQRGLQPPTDEDGQTAVDKAADRLRMSAKEGDLPSVQAGIDELVGNAKGAMDSIGARPGIYNTLGSAQAALDDLAEKHGPQADKTTARGLIAPTDTTPEAASDIQAQIAAMVSPDNPKDSVFIAKGTAAPKHVPTGVLRHTNKKTGDVYLTTNKDKFDTIKSIATPSEADRAWFLGIPEAKPEAIGKAAAKGTAPKGVTAKDKKGNVVAQAVTDEVASPNTAAVAAQVPPGGSLQVQKPQDVLAERATKVAAEQTPVEKSHRDANNAFLEMEKATDPKEKAKLQKKYDKAVQTWYDETQKATPEQKAAFVAPAEGEEPKGRKPKGRSTADIEADYNASVEAIKANKDASKTKGLHQASQALMGEWLQAKGMPPVTETPTTEKKAEPAAATKAKETSHRLAKEKAAPVTRTSEQVEKEIDALRKQQDALLSKDGKQPKDATKAKEWLRLSDEESVLKDEWATLRAAEKRAAKKEASNAVQEPSAAGVLQQPSQGTRKPRRKRGGVEQEQQGEKPAAQGQADTEKVGKGKVTGNELPETVGFDENGDPATLRIWADGNRITRASVTFEDGAEQNIALRKNETIHSLETKLAKDDYFRVGQSLVDEGVTEGTEEVTDEGGETEELSPEAKRKQHESRVNQKRKKTRAAIKREMQSMVVEPQVAADEDPASLEAYVNGKLDEEWGKHAEKAGKDKIVTFVDVPEQYREFVEVFEDITGQKVQFFSPYSKQMDVDGFKIPGDPYRVYVSVNSSEVVAFVTGHEFGHNIAERNPVLWRNFVDIVLKLADQKEFKKYQFRIQKSLEAGNRERGESQPSLAKIGAVTENEVSSDAIGTAMKDPEFWKLLKAAAREEDQPILARMMREVAAMVQRWMAALKLYMSGIPNVKRGTGAAVPQMFNDLRELNRAVRDLLLNYNAEMAAPPKTAQELSDQAGKFWDEKMEPETDKGQYKWADLDPDFKEQFSESYELYEETHERWVNAYEQYQDGDMKYETLERIFKQINSTQYANDTVATRKEAGAQTKERAKAGVMWDEEIATAAAPDFADLSAQHKNHFIREAFKKEGADETGFNHEAAEAAFQQIMLWRSKESTAMLEEGRRTDVLAQEAAEKKAELSKAEDKRIAAAEKAEKRLADIAKVVKAGKKHVTKRLKSLTDNEKKILVKFYGKGRAGAVWNENIAKSFSDLVDRALIDPSKSMRDEKAVPKVLKPIVRRMIGNILGDDVKYSRAGMAFVRPGEEMQAVDTDSANFQKWFADSKITDRYGNPKIMYHGTAFNIDAFKRGTGDAIFVSPNPDLSDTYAKSQAVQNADRGAAAMIYPVYIRAEMPFDYENKDHVEQVVTQIIDGRVALENEERDRFDEDPMTEAQIDHMAGELRFDLSVGLWNLLEEQDVQAAMHELGFDSFHVHENGVKNLAVYSPSQIKSAISNTGAFSNDTRIQYAKQSVREEAETPLTRDEMKEITAAAKHLTPKEIQKLRSGSRADQTAINFLTAMSTLPSFKEMAAVAWAGRAKRGWYKQSMEAIQQVFGMDAPRFTALLAATSPRTSVESNTHNALTIWRDWVQAGRPTSKDEIERIVTYAVQTKHPESRDNKSLTDVSRRLGIPTEGMDRSEMIANLVGFGRSSPQNQYLLDRQSVLPAWFHNSVRALSAENPSMDGMILSGPKADSFYRNLTGDTNEITNDAWMSAYALVDQELFRGNLNAAGTDPGKGAGYLAMNARTREAAKYLSKLTGDNWSPMEVQETIWAWAKTLYELQEKKGESRDAVELLRDGALTDKLISATVDFRSLFADETKHYQALLRDAGLNEGVDRLIESNAGRDEATRQAPYARSSGKTPPFTERTQRQHERSAAAGLAYTYRKRLEEKAAKRAARNSPDARALRNASVQYSRKDMLNPIEIYAMKGNTVVGMATFNVPNQTWAVYKGVNGGDIQLDYTEHVAPNTADAINMLREKGVALIRRKNSPVTTDEEGHHDVWSKGPDSLFDHDTSAQPSNNQFVKRADAALQKLGVNRPDWWKNTRRTIQDSYIDVKMLLDDISRKGGIITAGNNVYQKISLYTGATGERLDTFKRRYSDPMEKAIVAAIQKGATMRDIETFLISEHAEERNDQIEKRTDGAKTEGSGMSTADANAALATYRRSAYAAELQTISKIADEISEFKVKTMEDSGLISHDVAAGLREYKHYRPLKGLDEDDSLELTQGIGVGTGFSGKTSLLKYAMGRDKKASHTISHMMLDAEAKIVRAGKNDVAKSLSQLARDFPDPKFWRIDEMKVRQVFNPETGTIRYQADNGAMASNIVTAFTNGMSTKITLLDQEFAEAMTNSKAAGSSKALEFLRRWNKYLAMMMTSLNPEWGIINAARDAQTAFFNIKSDPDMPPGIGKAFLKELAGLKGHRDVYKAIKDPDNPTGLGQAYRELEQAGGITKFFSLDTLADRVKSLSALEARIQNPTFGQKAKAALEKSRVNKALVLMEDANAMIEATPRVIMYKLLTDAGWEKGRAVDYAKNLTVNFNRRGTSQLLTSAYLFFNPAVQGTARLIEAVKTPQGQAVAGSLFAMGVVAGLTGNSGGDDDKNGIPDYQQISDSERATNLILWPHGPKVPLPYGWNAFYAMGNFAADAFFGRSPMQSAWAGAKAASNAFNPLGGADSKSLTGWFFKNVTPTVLDPILGLYTNENQFGSRIHREQNTNFGPKMPDSQMGSMGASVTSKAVTSGLNAATGGSAAKAGAIDINPDTLDYMFGQYFPGVGSSVVRSGSTVRKALAGEPTETREYPIVRRVLTEPSKGKVYEELQNAKDDIGEKMNVAKHGTPQERAEMSKEYPGWGGVAGTFTGLGKTVGDLQKRKALIMDGKLKVTDDTAEIAKIDTRVMELNNKMLKLYKETSARW